MIADRDDATAYDAVRSRDWDHVIDISSRAAHVEAAVAALGERAARWSFVSSVSVYSDDATIGADETAPVHEAAVASDEYEYGPQKVAAEDAVRTLGARALIVRPGLIVGDGDPSDRFGYWAAAFLRAVDEPVLLPPTDDRSAQMIDIDDLTEFVCTTSATGVINAIGDPHPLAEVLDAVRRSTGHSGGAVTADYGWLVANAVEYWAGDRSMPLWLPADTPGFMSRSNERYRAAGGVLRPLDDTIERVIADEQERGILRDRRAGLTRADEVTLLRLLS